MIGKKHGEIYTHDNNQSCVSRLVRAAHMDRMNGSRSLQEMPTANHFVPFLDSLHNNLTRSEWLWPYTFFLVLLSSRRIPNTSCPCFFLRPSPPSTCRHLIAGPTNHRTFSLVRNVILGFEWPGLLPLVNSWKNAQTTGCAAEVSPDFIASNLKSQVAWNHFFLPWKSDVETGKMGTSLGLGASGAPMFFFNSYWIMPWPSLLRSRKWLHPWQFRAEWLWSISCLSDPLSCRSSSPELGHELLSHPASEQTWEQTANKRTRSLQLEKSLAWNVTISTLGKHK